MVAFHTKLEAVAMERRYANDEGMSAQRRTLSKARERDKGNLRETRVA